MDEPTSPAAESSELPTEKSSAAAAPQDPGRSAVVNRAMKKMAESAPESVVEMTAMIGSMMGHPLHQKMDAAHITQMLDLAKQHDANEYQLRKQQQTSDSGSQKIEQWSELIYFVVFVGLLLAILVLFKSQPNILVPLISGVGGAALGFVGGVGHGRANPKRKSKVSDSD